MSLPPTPADRRPGDGPRAALDDAAALDAALEALAAAPPPLPDRLTARILADAAAAQRAVARPAPRMSRTRRPERRRGHADRAPRRLPRGLGAAALAASALIGFGLGVAPPERFAPLVQPGFAQVDLLGSADDFAAVSLEP